ncbi:MAG: enoyl-CoA hydratase/isomerase family protein [Rhodospirillales bacterium]|nr:enoyl-CoA hydratase/isomerase family protein [Rhodospirillales bacterium]
MDEPIHVEVDAWLTLNRPEVHNAFDDTLIGSLTKALRDLGRDPAVRVVALASKGKNFSAGADLNWMRRMAGNTFEENVADAMKLAEMLETLHRLPKPTVAVVQGPAYGGGVGLIAACDIAIAAKDAARFALTEVRLGLIPATISPYVIAAIGQRQATRYFLTAETFDAADAVRLGLVHIAVPAEALAATAQTVLTSLAACAPGAQAACKELVSAVAGRPVNTAVIRDTAERIAKARASDEARERIGAFLEKRL